MTLQDTKGVKTAEEINDLINDLTEESLDKIRKDVNPNERYLNHDTDWQILSEEIDQIVETNVKYVAGIGQAQHCKSETDDMFFYASILEHQSWSSYTDKDELFDTTTGWSSKATGVARDALTVLYDEVSRRVYNTLEKERERMQEN